MASVWSQALGRVAAAPFIRAEPEPRLVTAVPYRLRLAVAAASQHRPRRCCAKPNDAAFQQRTARGGRSSLAHRGYAPRARRAGKAGWSAAPTGPGSTGHAAKPAAWSSRALAVTGSPPQRRQRPRRRITPNTNTSTTTMISTHNHVDMAASLVGAGAVRGDATAAHPSKQLGHGQATARAGSTAALRAGSRGTLHPATCPGGAEPFGPRPASPAQPPHPAPHQRRTRQAATDPT